MIVYIVRHAPAEQHDPDRWPDDAQRPLTKKGKRKFGRAAEGLTEIAAKPEVHLTSPFTRARQTAELLVKRAGWPDPVEAPQLAGGSDPAETLPLLAEHSGVKAVALVGHEPHVSELTSLLLSGDRHLVDTPFKKGGFACLEFSGEIAPGRAQLLWFLGPGALRRFVC